LATSKKKALPYLYWQTDPPDKVRAKIEIIEPFSARGMGCVYGRGDHWPNRASCHMDIWINRRGELFARFWSRGVDVDWMSIAIKGIPLKSIPDRTDTDSWVPKQVRDEYESWVIG